MIIAKPYLSFNHPASPPSAMLGAGPRFDITEYGLPATGSVKRIWRARRPGEANCCENCACGSACPGCPDPGYSSFRGLGSPLDLFDSPVWKYRKWIVLGGVGLLGLSILAGAGALLR